MTTGLIIKTNMALSNEDKKDVRKSMGKALAKKIDDVTHDSRKPNIWKSRGDFMKDLRKMQKDARKKQGIDFGDYKRYRVK